MISIIIPIYKAEKFLTRCVDSVIAQTYKDWECILVDDGSPDKSGVICDEYSLIDSRIHSYHKSNGGVSSARNFGVENSHGEWISFVDADDCLKPTFLESLCKFNEADLIITGWENFGDSKIQYNVNNKCWLVQDFVNILYDRHFFSRVDVTSISYPWGKLFRSDIINSNKIMFDEHMKLSEDTCFLLEYLKYSNRIQFVGGAGYKYFVSKRPKAHLKMTSNEFLDHIQLMTEYSNSFASKYSKDSRDFLRNKYALYFNAFVCHLKELNYSEFARELDIFRTANRTSINTLTCRMSFQKRNAIRLISKSTILMFLLIKLIR